MELAIVSFGKKKTFLFVCDTVKQTSVSLLNFTQTLKKKNKYSSTGPWSGTQKHFLGKSETTPVIRGSAVAGVWYTARVRELLCYVS